MPYKYREIVLCSKKIVIFVLKCLSTLNNLKLRWFTISSVKNVSLFIWKLKIKSKNQNKKINKKNTTITQYKRKTKITTG